MNQHHNDFADTSRDLGAWAADVADVPGVDEISMATRAMGMMLDSLMIDNEHANTLPCLDAGLFHDDRPTTRPVIGE